ncbi:Uncharacterised protein [Klebsiella pneumoniae]|nr:Uncharacterised protein [Klebsiella pneumoniae]
MWGVGGQDRCQRRPFIIIPPISTQEITVHQTLYVRMQVRFRLLNYEKRMVSFSIIDKTIKFEAFQGQKNQISRPQTGIANATNATVKQQAQAT